VYRMTAVPISLSLVTQAGLLENLHRLDTVKVLSLIVEEVAHSKADTPSPGWGRVLLNAVRGAPWGPWLRRG
jgi:hypothetical protein